MRSASRTLLMPSKMMMFFNLFLLAFEILLAMPGVSLAGNAYWWDHHWAKRQLIGSNASNSAYTTSHYLYITIDTSSSTDFQTDCDDLRIVYQSDTAQTEIGRYVSGCTQTGTKVYFQTQANINSNTDIDTLGSVYYVYYKNSGSSATSTTYTNTNFPQAPFSSDANTLGLYYMDDASCGANELCNSGAGPDFNLDAGTETWVTGTSARVGWSAIDCVSNNYTTSNPNWDDAGAEVVTIDVWLDIDSTPNANDRYRWMGSGDTWEMRTPNASRVMDFDIHKGSSNTNGPDTALTTNTWTHLRFQTDTNASPETWQAWFNGAEDPAGQQNDSVIAFSALTTTMSLCASQTNTAQKWDGQIDELRISKVARGAPDWVSTEIATSLNTVEAARTRRMHLLQ